MGVGDWIEAFEGDHLVDHVAGENGWNVHRGLSLGKRGSFGDWTGMSRAMSVDLGG